MANAVNVGKKFSAKKKNAEKRGIKFDITKEDLEYIYSINDGYCDYTGIKFREDDNQYHSSLERIDPNLGYERGNLCLVSCVANVLKDAWLDSPEIPQVKISPEYLPVLEKLDKLTQYDLELLKRKYITSKEIQLMPAINEQTKSTKVTVVKGSLGTKFLSSTGIEIQAISKTENKVPESNPEPRSFKSDTNVLPKAESASKSLTEASDETLVDVKVADVYVKMSDAAQKSGKQFDLKFHEFKIKYLAKTCKLTGKALTFKNRYMLVLDKNLPIDKNNVAVVEYDFGTKIQQFADQAHLSVPELAKTLKGFIK